MAVIIDAPNIEACASPLTTEAGDEAGLALTLRCIDGAYLYAAAHDPQQPIRAINIVSL